MLVLSVEVSRSMVPRDGDVAVLGSLDEFGAWDEARAVPMARRRARGQGETKRTAASAFASTRTSPALSISSAASDESEAGISCPDTDSIPTSLASSPDRSDIILPRFRIKGNSSKKRGCRETWELRLQLPVPKPSTTLRDVGLEYKYVVRDRHGKIKLWEVILGNRMVYPGRLNCTQHPETAPKGAHSPVVAQQSSTYTSKKEPFPGLRVADIAVNGWRSAQHEWHCSHTEKDAQAWWGVDLGKPRDIDFVRIWNRCGATAPRIFPCWVLLSESPFPPWRSNTLAECRALAVYEHRIDKSPNLLDENIIDVVPAATTRARYVRVCAEGETFLHMGQVQVISHAAAVALASSALDEASTNDKVDDDHPAAEFGSTRFSLLPKDDSASVAVPV